MQAERTKRFRGVWRTGEHYLPGDIIARGRNNYEAISDHVAGCQSEPGIGGHWPSFWMPTDGMLFSQPASQAMPEASHRPEASGPDGLSSPPALPSNVTRFPAPLSSAAPPAAPPKASEIEDDGDSGGVNVAHSLSLMRAALRHAARVEQVEELIGLLRRLERRIDAAGSPALEDPISAEAWRRKGQLLSVATRREAEEAMFRLTREYVRFLRKRDRGLHLTPQEAARFAMLDALDQALLEIEQREEELRAIEPPDIGNDKHWPTLGARS